MPNKLSFVFTLIIICIVAPVALIVPTVAQLENDPADMARTARQYAAVGHRTLNNTILPAFNKVLSPPKRDVLSKIDWRFPSDINIFEVFAFRDNSGINVIFISGGFVYIMDSVIDAFLIADHFDKGDAAATYFTELVRHVRSNANAHIQNEPPTPIPSFEQYAAIPQSQVDAYHHSPEYQVARQALFVAGLAIVVGHELGHHILNHTSSASPSAEVSRQREADADAYAIKLSLKAGFSSIGAVAFAGLLASLEGDPNLLHDDASHPPAICRQFAFLVEGAAPLIRDPDFERYLSANPGQRPKANMLVASIPTLTRFYKLCCSGNSWNGECSTTAGYCIPLLTILHAASSNFEILKGALEIDEESRKRWKGTVTPIGVRGCHINILGQQANYTCEEGYMADETERQTEYLKHTSSIARCAEYLGTTWDIKREEDDSDGDYLTSFSPEGGNIGRVQVEKRRDSQNQLFVRLTFGRN